MKPDKCRMDQIWQKASTRNQLCPCCGARFPTTYHSSHHFGLTNWRRWHACQKCRWHFWLEVEVEHPDEPFKKARTTSMGARPPRPP